MKILLKRDQWAGLLLGLFALFLYSTTRSSSLISIDAGELAAVQALLGIAHPSGYPLFTMAGHLWSKLPLGMTSISQLNLLATLYSAISVPFFFRAFFIAIGQNKGNDVLKLIAASSGVLILILGQTFWSTSTGTEVHSLQLLLISIALWLIMRACFAAGRNDRMWMYVACALGLCFTNHLTAVILIPGVAYLFFNINDLNRATIRTLLKGTACFVVTVTLVYSYLWIRATQNPAINWGDPDNLNKLWIHIRAKQYNVYVFESFDIAWQNLRYFVTSLPGEFSFIGAIVFLWGMYVAMKANRLIASFFAICILSNVALAINYNIPDLTPYFLVAFVSIAVFISFGIYHLMESQFARFSWPGSLVLASVIPLVLVFKNFGKVDQSSNYVIEDYITNALMSVEENAIVLSNEFETDISPAYYFQLVEGLRSDVIVIDFLSFIGEGWYAAQLELRHPELVMQVQQQFDLHQAAMARFDGQDQEAREEAQRSFKALINQIVLLNFENRSIYIAHGVYRDYLRPGGYMPLPFDHWIVPQTYYYRIYPNKQYRVLESSYKEPDRYPETEDTYTFDTQRFGKPNNEVYRDPKYHIGEIRFARALLMDHRIQYEIKNEKWTSAQDILEILENTYPAYKLDSRVLKAVKNRVQVK